MRARERGPTWKGKFERVYYLIVISVIRYETVIFFLSSVRYLDAGQIIALLSGVLFRAADNYIIACLVVRPAGAITNASHVIFSFGARS